VTWARPGTPDEPKMAGSWLGRREGFAPAAACGGLVLNNYFRLLTAFLALESAHLAL
jgi:hypothetical protein